MTVDARTRHLRQLRRLRRSARGWSVRAGLLVGATTVLVPYHGLGLPDAAWAAAAGGSVALTVWRWVDLRALNRLPVPLEATAEAVAAQNRARLVSAVQRLPAGPAVIEGIRRQRDQFRMRGTSVAELWRRLDQAAVTLSGMRGRLAGPAVPALTEVSVAESALRELAERSRSVEHAMRTASGPGEQALAEAHTALIAQLSEGVGAYEQLVGAAAAYLAEDTRVTGKHPAINGLTEAAELLNCVAASLSELRRAAP